MVKKKAKTRKKAIEKKQPKKRTWWDNVSSKLAVISFIFILFKFFPWLVEWVTTTDVWWFVLAFVVFAMKPIKNLFKKD